MEPGTELDALINPQNQLLGGIKPSAQDKHTQLKLLMLTDLLLWARQPSRQFTRRYLI